MLQLLLLEAATGLWVSPIPQLQPPYVFRLNQALTFDASRLGHCLIMLLLGGYIINIFIHRQTFLLVQRLIQRGVFDLADVTQSASFREEMFHASSTLTSVKAPSEGEVAEEPSEGQAPAPPVSGANRCAESVFGEDNNYLDLQILGFLGLAFALEVRCPFALP